MSVMCRQNTNWSLEFWCLFVSLSLIHRSVLGGLTNQKTEFVRKLPITRMGLKMSEQAANVQKKIGNTFWNPVAQEHLKKWKQNIKKWGVFCKATVRTSMN